MNKLRYVAKSLVHGALELSGRPNWQREKLRGSLIILTYHSFCTGWPNGPFQSQPIDRFERQLQYLKKYFNLVTLARGLSNLQQELIADKPWAAITIDDGIGDNYTHAWPVLKRFDAPATIFLATDFIDTGQTPWPIQIAEILHRTEAVRMEYPFDADLRSRSTRSAALRKIKNEWCTLQPSERFAKLTELRKHLSAFQESQYQPLTWEQIREMQESGIAFGSHTVFHSIISKTDTSIAELEVVDSKKRIEEELQVPCNYFAYPDGGHSEAAANLVRLAGYLGALTQNRGPNKPRTDAFRLNRLEVPHHDPIVTFRVRTCENHGIN